MVVDNSFSPNGFSRPACATVAGGRGSVAGVLLGAVLIALVNNALVLLTVPTYWQQAFIGAVIIGAALIDRIRR